MNFEEWYLDNREDAARDVLLDTFKAGAQSQQAKIDCMKVDLDGANERAMMVLNHKNVMVDKMQAKIDELQKLRSLDEMEINQLAQANQVWQIKCDELKKKLDCYREENKALLMKLNLPDGYKLVSVEPPEDMDIKICRLVDHRIDVFEADRIYKAMIGVADE